MKKILILITMALFSASLTANTAFQSIKKALTPAFYTAAYSESYTKDARTIAQDMGIKNTDSINVYTSDIINAKVNLITNSIYLNNGDIKKYPDGIRSTLGPVIK